MKWFNDIILRYAERIALDRAIKSNREEDYSPKVNLSKPRGLNMVGAQAISAGTQTQFSRQKSLNFSLHPAEGGYILEYNHYDENHDRHHQRLHIINDSDNMGESIANILTLELLRR
jgi:hypothetical protein